MASLKINNLSPSTSNLLLLSDVPNILTVEEAVAGTKAEITLEFEGNLAQSVTADSQYSISILGNTITNVTDASNASGKRFFISTAATSTAASVAMALRNCSSLASTFNIYQEFSSGIYTSTVILEAREIGAVGLGLTSISQNIPAANLEVSMSDGTSTSSLLYGKVLADVISSNNVLATLEKNFYSSSTSFDISPVLATIGEYGDALPFDIRVGAIANNGQFSTIGTISGHTTLGYQANGSSPYLIASTPSILLNSTLNGSPMKLYMADVTIPYAAYAPSGTSSFNVVYKVYDSVGEVLTSTTETVTCSDASKRIYDKSYEIPSALYTTASYVGIKVGSSQEVVWYLIKPLKASEHVTRICWYNEFGGISFFDFTSQESEDNNLNNETYEKSNFDFYTSSSFEQSIVYRNEVEREYRVQSHLMDKQGTWHLQSLMRAKKAWVAGTTRQYIIPKNLDIQEDDSFNDVFRATFTFNYSYLKY